MQHVNYNSLETDNWSIQLPSNWLEKTTAQGIGKLYFESPDGSKGIYILTLRFAPDDHRSPMEHLNVARDIVERGLNDMAGYRWVRIQDEARADSETGEQLLDSYDREQQYRIIARVVLKLPYMSNVSLHDYLCDDIEISDQTLLPILNSFSLK